MLIRVSYQPSSSNRQLLECDGRSSRSQLTTSRTTRTGKWKLPQRYLRSLLHRFQVTRHPSGKARTSVRQHLTPRSLGRKSGFCSTQSSMGRIALQRSHVQKSRRSIPPCRVFPKSMQNSRGCKQCCQQYYGRTNSQTKAVIVQVFGHFPPKYAVIVQVLSD